MFKNDSPETLKARLIVVALAAGTFSYELLVHGSLGRSGLMFLGIPTLLAIILALKSRARTVTGGVVVGITLALLIPAPLMGEGYLCILLASPLFYLVGIAIGLAFDRARNNERNRRTTLGCIAIVMLPASMEGVFPHWTIDRSQTVEVTRIVHASATQVETALSASLRINTPLPRLLRVGFPTPLAARGVGLAVGSTRTIHFAGAEGDPPGDLIMKVTDRSEGFARFEAVSDTSKLLQWVRWDRSDVAWRAVDSTHTAVTWRIRFDRQLDPAWYFGWLERLAVRDAAAYLIDANAAPEPER